MKKTNMLLLLVASGLVLAACDNGVKDSSSTPAPDTSSVSSPDESSPEEPKTILDSLLDDIASGNGYIYSEGVGKIIGLDRDTFVVKYEGDYVYYYYDSGSYFVDGLG